MPGNVSRQNGKKGGRPKGRKSAATLDKEAAREALRAMVLAKLEPLVSAQIDNATGISHFMLRDAKTGKFERVTSKARILEALNAQDAEDGKTYFYIYTKDPSVSAFTGLMNRTIDKPAEQVNMDMNVTSDEELISAMLSGRARVEVYRNLRNRAPAARRVEMLNGHLTKIVRNTEERGDRIAAATGGRREQPVGAKT